MTIDYFSSPPVKYYLSLLSMTGGFASRNSLNNSVKMKEKFSISVDDDLLKWLDSEIKNKRFASRSHGIEFALNELKKES